MNLSEHAADRRVAVIGSAVVVIAAVVITVIVTRSPARSGTAQQSPAASSSSLSTVPTSTPVPTSATPSASTSSESGSSGSGGVPPAANGTPTASIDPSGADVSGQPAVPTVNGVDVQITAAQWDPATRTITLSASVAGAITNLGTCSAEARNGNLLVASASIPGIFNGRGTSCGTIQVLIPAGPYTELLVKVIFTSPTASGSSAQTNVAVS